MNRKQEQFAENFPSLPCNFFENELDGEVRTVPLHWHNRLEVIHVLSGRGVISIELQDHSIAAGDIVTVPPGALHAVRGAQPPLHCQTVSFSLDGLPLHPRPVIRPDQAGSAAFVHTLDALFALAPVGGPEDETLLQHYLRALCGLYHRFGHCLAAPAETPFAAETLKRVLLYMEQHCAQPLTVEDLAAVSGYSKYHFSRFFTAAVGCSCMRYLQRVRLRQARRLLLHTDLSVADVAQKTGFGEVSYFIRVFRQDTGVTPLRFRREALTPSAARP